MPENLTIPRDVWMESAKRQCTPQNKGPIIWALSSVMGEFDKIEGLEDAAHDAVRDAITKVIAIYDKHAKESRTPAPAAQHGGTPDSYPARLLHESDASLAERVDSWHQRNPAAPAAQQAHGARYELVKGCKSCRHCMYDTAGTYHCGNALRRFDGIGKPDATPTWCPLPLLAAPTPSAAPVALTKTHMQTVPDHCDRIVWRNSYYGPPLAAPADHIGKRDEMVGDVGAQQGWAHVLMLWQAICDEAQCVVLAGKKHLMLTEEMLVRLGGAIEDATPSAAPVAMTDAQILGMWPAATGCNVITSRWHILAFARSLLAAPQSPASTTQPAMQEAALQYISDFEQQQDSTQPDGWEG